GNWIITRVWAHGMIAGAVTAVMGLQGYIQIESQSCQIAPCQFPLEPITGPLGTGETYGKAAEPEKYVVNCPAKGGTVLNVYHVCDATITTTTVEIMVTVEFAEATPFPGGQLHMKMGEPSVAGSVSDGGVVSLTDIEIEANQIMAVVVYCAQTTIVTATGIMLMFEMKSDDFVGGGPQRWGLNTQRGGVATNCASSGTETFRVEVDAAFRKPGQKQTVSAEVTAYDAVSTGPIVNWCLIYT
ncbi:unnamed protein product, partial [marine sediment metagenome]